MVDGNRTYTGSECVSDGDHVQSECDDWCVGTYSNQPGNIHEDDLATMSGDGATRSLAIAAAGIAAVIGVAGLQITRSSTPTTKRRTERHADDVDVALLKLHVPRDWRDVVKNDVYLDKTVARAVERLVIYVVGGSRPAVINYVSELYNLTWDVACIKNRPHLDIRILGATMDKGVPTWEDLVALPELNAVFMDDDAVTPDQLNALRDGLAPISFQPLGGFTAPYFRDDLHYFENRETNLQGHSVVLLGGTFDHLHNGHKKLLSLAVGISHKKLIIGITSEEMLRKKKHANLIESLEVREHKVRAYVTFLKPSLEVEFAVLTDAFGPAIDVANPDAALVVSTETIAAVPLIQDIRSSRGLTPLQIFVCRRTDASTLSSSYIRDRLAERNAQRR